MGDEDAQMCVRVAVRVRPINGKEKSEGATVACTFPSGSEITLKCKNDEPHFAFDFVFHWEHPQVLVYESLGLPLIGKAFEGFNSTIFAYGQTGCGKTHTMMNHRAEPAQVGLIPRISDGIYKRIADESAEHPTRKFLVQCSFLEIYNEIIKDLLAPADKVASKGGLEIREQKGMGIYVKDLTEVVVENSDRLNALMELGFDRRVTAATKMNAGSSRSHSVFVMKLHQKDDEDQSRNTFSKLNLVDLAGSERAKSTEAEGDRLKEGANINKSLSALGNVINALSSLASGKKGVFIPYRNSKLTRVLQESLGGNSLCTMICAMSPTDTNAEETLSTLNYGKRAKSIKVAAVKNDESSQIKKLEEEVSALKKKLESQAAGGGVTAEMSAAQRKEIEDKYESQINELQGFMQQSWDDKQKVSQRYEEERLRAVEESRRTFERFRQEKQRRLQMLEQNGDLKLSTSSVLAFNSKLLAGASWPAKIEDAMKAEQQVRSQIRAIKLYRESAVADFAFWYSQQGTTSEVAALTLVSQTKAKLNSMSKELEKLAQIEAQTDEFLGQLGPEIGSSVREAQEQVATAQAATAQAADAAEESEAAAKDDQTMKEDLLEHLLLVQRQLTEQHGKICEYVRTEKQHMSLSAELGKLKDTLEESSASGSPVEAETLEAIKTFAAAAADAAPATNTEVPRNLGLSTFEVPDDRIIASSNSDSARAARLLQVLCYGGWCPQESVAYKEYLEIDLGEEVRVTGVSVQGRIPCTCEWQQTRDLLQLAVAGEALPSSDKLPTAEKIFKRPPVRLIHDIGVMLGHGKQCFKTDGEGWDVPEDLRVYGDLSREQKVQFFDALISETNKMWAPSDTSVALTSQEILSGKNCEQTNKLLQLVGYLALRCSSPNQGGGLLDVVPQWTKQWKLSYFTEDSDWKWCGEMGDEDEQSSPAFEGNMDALAVNKVDLLDSFVASKVRVYPVSWHKHPSLRCEIHVVSKHATVGAARRLTSSSGRKGSELEDAVTLVVSGLAEVQKCIEAKRQAKLKEEEAKLSEVSALKSKAEQERDVLEQRLKDALARVEAMDAENEKNLQRALESENSVLQMQVERDQLVTQKEQLEKKEEASGEEKGSLEEQVNNLQEEAKAVQNKSDELEGQLQVVTEERDAARNKEEEVFDLLNAKEEELVDTNNGYVYLTEMLQEKEEELENVQKQNDSYKDTLDLQSKRVEELQNENLSFIGQLEVTKTKLAEEERMHEAAKERYMGLLKQGMGATSGSSSAIGSRPTTGAVVSPPVPLTPSNVVASSKKHQDEYEEEFEDED